MKRLSALLVVAALTVVILIFFTNPGWLDKIWLWIIGFIGYILVLAENAFKTLAGALKKETAGNSTVSRESISSFFTPSPAKQDKTKGLEEKISSIERELQNSEIYPHRTPYTFLSLFRFFHDENSTFGLLFLGNEFFAFTSESPYRKDKGLDPPSIPMGTYIMGLHNHASMHTQMSREKYPWFDGSLEIQRPGLDRTFLGFDLSPKGTPGSIWLLDGFNRYDTANIAPSIKTFEKFYKIIHPMVQSGMKVHLKILDECWFRNRLAAV